MFVGGFRWLQVVPSFSDYGKMIGILNAVIYGLRNRSKSDLSLQDSATVDVIHINIIIICFRLTNS